MFKIEPSKKFLKQLKKLPAIDRKQIKNALWNLSENPRHPSLRTKKYQSMDGVFESSVNMDIRILWEYKLDTENVILLLLVGHHDLL